MDISLEPYLYFRGNCHEAMEFYQKIFGGKLSMMTYAETPGIEGNKDWIMHASLKGNVSFMASDTENALEQTQKISLSLGGTDESKMTEIFNQLSGGGKVLSPLKKEFWGDTFGSLTDKFGVDWMVNIGSGQEQPNG